MEFCISGSLDYKREQEFCLQGVLVGNFSPQNDQWPTCSQPRWYFCLKLWKGRSHTTCLEWRGGMNRAQPQADAIILHCSFLGGMSGAAGRAQPWVLHSNWPKTSEAMLLSPFLLCICECPKFITSMSMETVFLLTKMFPNTFSHCMPETFLASKWSYLLPALVAVEAWRGRVGTGHSRAQGCASHPSHVQALYTAVTSWGTKQGRAAQELDKLDGFK